MKKTFNKSRDTFDENDQKMFEKSLAKLTKSTGVSEKSNASIKGKKNEKLEVKSNGSINGKKNEKSEVKSNRKVKETKNEQLSERRGRSSEVGGAVKPRIGTDSKGLGKTEKHYGKLPKSESKEGIKRSNQKEDMICKHFRKCGACQHLDQSYEHQLAIKQKQVETLLKHHCTVHPIIGMDNPYHYRNKVQAVFTRDARGNIISGTYKEGTHQVVSIDKCLIEDQKADDIIRTIRNMLKSFKIKTYDEDTGYGLLRYVLVKRGITSKEIMVVLVIGSPIFPSKNNFVKALREAHPEITTIVLNVNDRTDSLILGNKESILYGKGFIEDTLCGNVYRISSKSFYQVNPVQTEVLYDKAIKAAQLTGKETVIDAYCGIGTIGLVAAKYAKEVIGVELNKDAFKDAIANAKRNEIKNIRFINADASDFMEKFVSENKAVEVVFMDPPRSGSTELFIDSVAILGPKRVVYVSCNPMTLEKDLRYFEKKGYEAKEAWPVDMFPWTGHVECVIMMTNSGYEGK
jgi:23S rRNA (uracil1939-C5)-methyltransferase